MREGLLVIDQEMRVIASNQSARNIFSNIDESMNSRRLTELTRTRQFMTPSWTASAARARRSKSGNIWPGAAGFRSASRALRAADGRGAGGALGVFFDVTRLSAWKC